MKNAENDNEMKGLMKSSMLEITNPGFNAIILKKIMMEDKRKFVIKKFCLYFLLILTVCTFIILITRSAFPNQDTTGWYQVIAEEIAVTGRWFIHNIHLLGILLILALLKKVIHGRLKTH
ncbi:MAG: hypothetical protein ABIQ31_25175 [Ferruginibacter sp.]